MKQKRNDFSQLVADEYLKLFNFESLTLDAALRKFLKQFQLTGDAQEKERVLMYFAKRYVDQNITAFNDVGMKKKSYLHITDFTTRLTKFNNLTINFWKSKIDLGYILKNRKWTVIFLKNNNFIQLIVEFLRVKTIILLTQQYPIISDSCHTLTCALMLLNTDLHDPVMLILSYLILSF